MFPRNNRKGRLLHRWHRRLGLCAGLFTLWITLSGIALNHSAELGLDRRHLPEAWRWVGQNTPPPSITAYETARCWIIQLNGRLYRDHQEIASHSAQLIGAVSTAQMLIAVTRESLWLFDDDGQLIEQIDRELILPAPPENVATTPEHGLLLQAEGKWYGSDEFMLRWRPVRVAQPRTASAGQPPETIIRKLQMQYSGQSMNYEQLLLNFHTGRLFGAYGVYLVDLIAIALAALAISGFSSWLKRRRYAK